MALSDNRYDCKKMSNYELMKRVQEGDKAAFDEIVRRYSKAAVRCAFRILRNTEDAKDAVQDAFVKLWRHASSWRGPTVTSWIFTIVVRCSLSILEKRSRRSKKEVRLLDTVDPPDMRTPESNGTSQDKARYIDDCLNALPPQLRNILILRYYFKVQLSVLAADLNLTMAELRRRLKKALLQMQTCLKEKGLDSTLK